MTMDEKSEQNRSEDMKMEQNMTEENKNRKVEMKSQKSLLIADNADNLAARIWAVGVTQQPVSAAWPGCVSANRIAWSNNFDQ